MTHLSVTADVSTVLKMLERILTKAQLDKLEAQIKTGTAEVKADSGFVLITRTYK